MANESNSSVVRVHKNTDFTIMSNHHLRNQKLSLKAIGLMSKILGLPCDWNYSIAGLVKICKEGETAVRAALHELIDERYTVRRESGTAESAAGCHRGQVQHHCQRRCPHHRGHPWLQGTGTLRDDLRQVDL